MHAGQNLEDLTLTVRSLQAAHERATERAYLLVFDASSVNKIPLPPGGELVIGRAPEAHVRVDDASVSRLHAKVLVAGGTARIVDLDSHNGTRVNGEVVKGSRLLGSGDVILVSTATPIVFHRDSEPEPARAVLDAAALRTRLEEELERALRYQSTFSLLAVHLLAAKKTPARTDPVAALAGQLRLLDAVAKTSDDRLAILLPELGPGEALPAARALLAALAAAGHDATAGLAVCPDDGCDADALLQGARAAATLATSGDVRLAADAYVTRTIAPGVTVTLADPAMIRVFELLEKLATAEVPVVIHGETGSGKEIAATALHHGSRRSKGPLVAINCASIPEHLVESELFGYEKGAFSGALGAKPGLIESAHGGTLFLDELGELPLAAQAKLLRVLETKKLTRLGDLRERTVDVRVVCATHQNLEEAVRAGRFRQDLLYRLNTAKVILPPLRHRRRELPLLARTFLARACAQSGREVPELSAGALQALLRHSWPGNVRELKNTMELVAATASGRSVEPWDLPEVISGLPPDEEALPAEGEHRRFRPIDDEVRELERRRMSEALAATGGVQTRAAELIQMPLRTFVGKMKTYGLSSRSTRRA